MGFTKVMKKGFIIPFLEKNINSTASLIAVLHFVASIYTDEFFFDYFRLGRILVFKSLFLIVLLLLWNWLFALIRGIKNKTINILWFKCTTGYFCILLLCTLATWPGFWEWDEFYILEANVTLRMHIWQSLMSNVIYILSLMLLPFPAGIVLIQIVMVSAIVGYVLYFAFSELNPWNNRKNNIMDSVSS